MYDDDSPHRASIGNGFRALTELAPDFVAIIDVTGRIKYVSPAITRVMGYLPSEVIGRPFLDFVHPQDHPKGLADLAKLLHTGDIVPTTLRFRHKDGSFRVLETLAKNYAEIPAVDGLLVSTRDITGHAELETSLNDALRETEDLYNNAPCGYHSLDENGVFVKINDTELSWLGRTREEVVGKLRFEDLLTPRSRPLFERQFPAFKSRGQVEDLEFELARKDGSAFAVLVSANVVRDEQGRYLMSRSALYDITERKLAEAALRRANRALLVLSAVNSELIHAEVEAGLLEAICRVSVEMGGYRMAWVGFAMQDEAKSIRPVAHAGVEDGYLEHARITWEDDSRGRGPTGTAIRTGVAQVNQDFLGNPAMAPWREDALRRGYQSSVALPLKDAGRAFGALMLYASEPDAFDAEELRLLVELADDLAFGIVTLRGRAQHRLAEQKIAHLAYFDDLTGLPNRTRLTEALAQSAADLRAGGESFALLVLNVVHFGEIQGAIGVQHADELLQKIASRLSGTLREGELLARIGGDEFAVLTDKSNAEQARECAQRLDAALSQPFKQAEIDIDVQIRIGAAIAPGHGVRPESMLLSSGIAARQARRTGATFVLYTGPTEAETPRYLALISELRAAIDARQLILYYQPKVELGSGRVCGVEALVRWAHPKRGLVPPGEFIRIAEHTGLIKPLTHLVLDAALHQQRLWRNLGFEISVAVNISANNFGDPNFERHLEEALRAQDAAPELLQIEITESTLMDNPAKVSEVLVRLRALGIRVSIDDFGTGYSSLSYVASLPIYALKIDRSFVIKMLKYPRVRSVVEATISLARTLGIRTVAEGVDAREQLEALDAMGVDEIQGYFFSPPLEAEALRRWTADFSLQTYGLRPAPK